MKIQPNQGKTDHYLVNIWDDIVIECNKRKGRVRDEWRWGYEWIDGQGVTNGILIDLEDLVWFGFMSYQPLLVI